MCPLNVFNLISLVMLSEAIGVGGIVALARVPHVLSVHRSVRILLNGEVSVSGHEVPEERAALAIRQTVPPLDVLRVKHSVTGDVSLGLGDHRREGLKVGPIVPAVAAA